MFDWRTIDDLDSESESNVGVWLVVVVVVVLGTVVVVVVVDVVVVLGTVVDVVGGSVEVVAVLGTVVDVVGGSVEVVAVSVAGTSSDAVTNGLFPYSLIAMTRKSSRVDRVPRLIFTRNCSPVVVSLSKSQVALLELRPSTWYLVALGTFDHSSRTVF
jgi:hypothetical protein